jgi:hypothetical protein
MKKLLVITPHLSTGGAPQVTVNKISLLKDVYEIKVVEYSCLSWSYVVQRNRIIEHVGQENLITLGDDKTELLKIIENFSPNIISMEEFPEMFMDENVADGIYSTDRTYKIFESSHESSFRTNNKRYFPDKFMFVSPYSALRLLTLDIPYEIVEYPVDIKPKNVEVYREKLDLDPEYKHVVNIGLFTPRKNQQYVFALAEKLNDYKIKFHFIGNQADNFKYYWEPLMKLKEDHPNKYDNCVVWGERSDTDDFLQASDLFLFTSKGERGNKELNPIVIKEALQYNMPMMMFNLDVYCGKYNNYENISFLTGDLNIDAINIIETLKPSMMTTEPEVIDTNDEIIVIGTYPNTKERYKLTVDCIDSLKKTGRKLLLVSHYPISQEIQNMVDFYVFDKSNPLIPHSYYNKFYNYSDQYDVEININGLKNTNQSLTVLTNMFNGFKTAKGLGFKRVLYMTYDVVLNQGDLKKVNEIFNNLHKFNAHLCYNKTPFGNGIETTSMGMDVDYFLNTFENIRTPEQYELSRLKFNCHNFLEDYFINAMDKDNILIEDNDQHTILPNSGLGVSSNSEYYSVIPITDRKDEYMLYFYTYNIDNRKIDVTIKEQGQVIYNEKFTISTNREFKKDIKYNGKLIEIDLVFYDEENQYKIEKIVMYDGNISDFANNGFFKFKTELPIKGESVPVTPPRSKPKIKLIHLQTNRNDLREQLSRKSLEPIKDYGIEYVLYQNEPYVDLPPKYNCIRPQCVSDNFFTIEQQHEFGGPALTPPHYGCYESFKIGILSEFHNEDFLIVCEGDCIIEVPMKEFVDKLYKVCEILPKANIGYFSFGDTETLDFGWHQSDVKEEVPGQNLLFITEKIIGLQCIMFPQFVKPFLVDMLKKHKWDAADLYFNVIFNYSSFKMGILKERITTQADGLSIIDNEYKTFRKK